MKQERADTSSPIEIELELLSAKQPVERQDQGIDAISQVLSQRLDFAR